jgi:hypothetical protein
MWRQGLAIMSLMAKVDSGIKVDVRSSEASAPDGGEHQEAAPSRRQAPSNRRAAKPRLLKRPALQLTETPIWQGGSYQLILSAI